jgi:hypothetical protein
VLFTLHNFTVAIRNLLLSPCLISWCSFSSIWDKKSCELRVHLVISPNLHHCRIWV